MEKVYEAKADIKYLNETEVSDEEISTKLIHEAERKKLKFMSEKEDEGEEPYYISWLWYISAILLVMADVFEIVIGFLGVITGGLLSILGFLPMLFEIPGGLIFLYLINYYVKRGDISQLEGGIYMVLVLIEFFGFIPFVGSLVEILPLKSIATLGSRTKLWRIKRLKAFKKATQRQIEE